MKRGNDPPRLRDLLRDRADPLARALEEMRDDEPSAEELRHVTRGVRLALGLPLAGSGHGGGAGTVAGALKATAAGAPLLSSFFVPMAAGAVTAGAVLVTVTQLAPPKKALVPPNIAPPAMVQAAPPALLDNGPLMPPPSPFPSPASDSERHIAPTPAAASVFRAPARSTASPPAASVAEQSLPATENAPQPTELDLVNRAQERLASDPENALYDVREHERRFPLGMLAQEREVIAIDALLRLGRRREAESRAMRFHVQYPQSAHGRRIDVLLQTAAP